MDAGYCNPVLLDLLDDLDVEYVIAVPSNKRLLKEAEIWMDSVRERSAESGQSEQCYAEFRYAAKTWSRQRRIILKAEVVQLAGREPKDNPRFLVTNIDADPYTVYTGDYALRGDVENRIKELQRGLASDRTSCTRFVANQFRLLQAAMAYVLIHEIRLAAANTPMARAQATTIRERLFKIGVRVVESVRRIVLHMPKAYPWQATWQQIARNLGAVPT